MSSIIKDKTIICLKRKRNDISDQNNFENDFKDLQIEKIKVKSSKNQFIINVNNDHE